MRSFAGLDVELAATVAQVMQALATPSRLLILSRLRQSPCPVGGIADAVGMTHSSVSHQLRYLRHLGLVTGERHGRSVVYRLHNDHVAALLDQAIHHIQHRRLSLQDPRRPPATD